MTETGTFSFLYLIDKKRLSVSLFYAGMLISFLGSLNPWFMWSIGNFYPVLVAPLLVTAYLVSRTIPPPEGESPHQPPPERGGYNDAGGLFTRNDFLLPLLTFVVYAVYERISMDGNLNSFLMIGFRLVFFYLLFRISMERCQQLVTFICKAMAVILIPSLLAHFLYLLGLPMPCRDAKFGEFYSFANYYFFLVSDTDLFVIFPRFNSYFLEPSHIGTACAFLLFCQRGQWRKWYNVTLLTTVFFTFSLASYIYLVAIMLFNSWAAGKQVVRKLVAIVIFLILATIVTFTYNGGNNMVHDLIALRLEIDDGEMAGDNRVTGNFEADYDNFVDSSDILFGRKYEQLEFGNAGYRVFFYDHGLVGIFLLITFYVASMMYSPNKRALIGVLVVAALYFWASAFMLWENIYLPLYAAAYSGSISSAKALET
jgi:hypothetical protein